MVKSVRKRIVIEIPENNPVYQRIYDHVSGSDRAKKNILDVYNIHFQPRALIESGADPLKILMATTSSVNQLYCQIQELVELLHSANIQAPPWMLIMAGFSGLPTTKANITAPVTQVLMPSPSPAVVEEDDDDDDWDIPPLTEAEKALVAQSEEKIKRLGGNTGG
jgi:hypothetical protein